MTDSWIKDLCTSGFYSKVQKQALLDQLKLKYRLRLELYWSGSDISPYISEQLSAQKKDLILPVCVYFVIYCPPVAAVGYCLCKLGWWPAVASTITVIFVGVSRHVPLTMAGACQGERWAAFFGCLCMATSYRQVLWCYITHYYTHARMLGETLQVNEQMKLWFNISNQYKLSD